MKELQCGGDFPAPQDADSTFNTLKLALDYKLRPPLEKRFQLARTLTQSVLNFHTVFWLQKGIPSFTMIFFKESQESCHRFALHPRFPLEPTQRQHFHKRPTNDSSHRDYQHPEYQDQKLRFRAGYDYYSLGLILLKIGLWKSLGFISKSLGRNMDISRSEGDE